MGDFKSREGTQKSGCWIAFKSIIPRDGDLRYAACSYRECWWMSVRNQRVKIMFLGRTLSSGGLPPQYLKQSGLPILFSSIFSTLLALTLCVASLFLGDAIGAVSEIWVPPRFTAPEPQGPVLKPSVMAHSSSAQRQAIRQIDLGSVPTKDFEAKTVQAPGGPTKAGFSRDIKGFMTVEDV